MRTLIFLLAFGLASISCAQVISTSDSLRIVSQIDDWNKAWKTKDYKLAAKWYSDDAEFTNAFGFSMVGRQAIEEYLAEVFAMDFVMAGESEQTSIKLKPIADNVVLVISTISRTGQKMSDNSALGPRRTTHHRLFKKEGDWQIVGHLISDARSTESSKH
ncbi:MAG: nuclear transport factor 2 family protein [Cyclobacteriaceae bacterium]|nr:nuclear transport factor 2 family protein [Cyclobacteriaceae bacterium]